MKQVALIILVISVIAAEKARFDFYRLYEVSVETEIHLELMRQITENPDGVNKLLTKKKLLFLTLTIT